MEQPIYRILVIDDDEDDYVIIRNLCSKIRYWQCRLEWVDSYAPGLHALTEGEYDVCLLDYRLGGSDGLKLLREAVKHGCRVPVIVLTGHGDHTVDLEAMKAGAADYLLKAELKLATFERSVRYAVERQRAGQKIRHLASQILTAQEMERNRIARELHDSIGGKLTAIKFGVEKHLRQMPQAESSAGFSVKDILDILKDAIEETRRISRNLQPLALEDLGLLRTLGSLCRESQELYSEIEVKTDLRIPEEAIPQNLKITIYRVCQEALNNIIKHSKASRASVSLFNNEGRIQLIITDNGRGFDREARLEDPHENGFGLAGMRQRAELSGGVLDVLSSREKGTVVKASWPSRLE